MVNHRIHKFGLFFRALGEDRSVLAIIAGNLMPLAGTLFFGWSAFDYLVLFWFESWIVFVFLLAKVKAMVAGGAHWGSGRHGPAEDMLGFCVAYVAFTVMQGFVLFDALPNLVLRDYGKYPRETGTLERIGITFASDPMLVAALVVLAASHWMRRAHESAREQSFRDLTVHEFLKRSFIRIPTLHIVLIAGSIIAIRLGERSALPVLALLVTLKVVTEVSLLHRQGAAR
jgi:hypothetical protein